MTRILTLLVFLAVGSFAQTATTPTTPVTTPVVAPTQTAGNVTGAPASISGLPTYFAAVGGGFAPTATLSTAAAGAEGWVSIAVQVGSNSPYFSVTTIDFTPTANTLRTGLARVMAQSGNTTLLARVDAGISTPTPTISSFSAGAIVMYNMKGFNSKLAGWYLLGEARITANPGGPTGTVQVGGYFGVGKSF